MKTRAIMTLGLSVLVFGGTMVSLVGNGGVALAGTQDVAKIAAKQFDLARRSLANNKIDAAISQAESAVGYDPQVAAYRVLLGQAYLQAGRFNSAQSAFADAVTLDPTNGKAALHLALSQIAEGHWDGARQTLDKNSSIIPVSDRGLAIALAGDPATAVELLDTAARSPEADAKTRQNYALALALAGRWADARTVVSMDVAPDQVDQRIGEWATFAKPTSASDQVASLLGVKPVADAGQPTRLALVSNPNVGLAAAAPIDTFMPAAPVAVAEAAAVAPAEVMPVAASVSNVSFAPRREVLQALPLRFASMKRELAVGATLPRAKVARVVRSRTMVNDGVGRAPAKGNFFVQLGAFDNAAVAKDAWGRMSRTHIAFAGQRPSGMPIETKAGKFYRLSVGGFSRPDAVALCQKYRAKGGACFVRAGAGDKNAAWMKPGVQLASR